MAGCQSCDSCQGCNGCQSCNTSCNSVGCNTIQAFCSIGGQSVGGFDFNQCISSNETFLTKTNWNRLITYIRTAYAEGNSLFPGGTGGDSGLPNSDTNIYMTAEMFNKVATALGGLGSEAPIFFNPDSKSYQSTMQTDIDIIYGSYFDTLEDYANNLKYTITQCDNCNAGCNVTCDGCQSCNSGGCQTNSPSSCCSHCNTCQVDTPPEDNGE